MGKILIIQLTILAIIFGVIFGLLVSASNRRAEILGANKGCELYKNSSINRMPKKCREILELKLNE